MCGIYGYIGEKNATEIVFSGLKRLDYRGYDSWGVGIWNNNKINLEKHAGKINKASLKLPKSSVAIGHTRWATHGVVSDLNAHPHFSADKSFILAQNGIVENFEELKKELVEKKHRFITQTDTEVIVRLIEEKLKKFPNLIEAVRQAFLQLEGRNTIILLSKTGEIIAARNGSPLVIGISDDCKEIHLSSDTLSFSPYVKKIIVIENGQMVTCHPGEIKLINIKKNTPLPLHTERLNIENNKVDKEGFTHFMIKEISESPYVISQVVKQNKAELVKFAKDIKKAKTVYTIGSGTAGAAAAQMAFYLRIYGKINAISLIGAEATEYCSLFSKDDIIISPSQSGETADVLEILEIVKKKGVKIATYVNMQGSMMNRMSDYKFLSYAGPEICVMSTKVFVSQLSFGYLIAKTVQGKYDVGIKNLKMLSNTISKYLKGKNNSNKIQKLARNLKNKKDLFLLSKAQNLQMIKEGMVKIIEGAYIHAHAIPAGDLKHYAITLMEKNVSVIAVLSNDSVKKDIINAINEVRARGAEIIGLAPENYISFDRFIKSPDTGETSAIMNIIPLQLLAYYLAVELKHDVDKPRNIAKSVTVK